MSCGLRLVREFLLFRAFHLAKVFRQAWLRLYVALFLARSPPVTVDHRVDALKLEVITADHARRDGVVIRGLLAP